jgi:hypothetical protein
VLVQALQEKPKALQLQGMPAPGLTQQERSISASQKHAELLGQSATSKPGNELKLNRQRSMLLILCTLG